MNIYFFKVAIELIKDYGILGICLLNFIMLIFVSWKLFTNHLRHLTEAVGANAVAIKSLTDLITENAKDISFIKGKINGK